jgi:hypothetical protein
VGTDLPYSLWGVLDPLAEAQHVRVFPIEGTLNPGRPEPLDARFVSTDLDTGAEQVWRDSVSVDTFGVVGHVFSAPLQVEYDHRYRVEITGADGRASWVEVEVPARTMLSQGIPDTTAGVLLSAYVLGDAPRLVRSELEFFVGYVDGFSASGCPNYTIIRHVVAYDDRIRPNEDGWWFLVNLEEVFAFSLERALLNPRFVEVLGITLGSLRFRTIVANEAWMPPNGQFDPNVLVQPGLMENVQNGFGFVGAGYHLSTLWALPPTVVNKSGFRSDYAECSMSVEDLAR